MDAKKRSGADWEAHYQSNETPWDKGEASPGLVDFLAAHPKLARGAVAVPGCGLGHDARAWARAGFAAHGLDIAPTAIERASMHPDNTGLNVRFSQANFLHDPPPARFDWVFEHTLFCAIQPEERTSYVEAVARWLPPGGDFLAVHYFIPDTDGPPFGTDREEIIRRFSPGLELLEEWVPRSYPNRTGLERMFWWRRR